MGLHFLYMKVIYLNIITYKKSKLSVFLQILHAC